MDKRIAFPGGEIGITQTELDLMPNSNREGMEAIASGLTNNVDVILSGVSAVISAGINVTLLAGWVFLDGEVLQVDAQVVPRTVGTDLYSFSKVVNSASSEFDRLFRSGVTNNVAEIQRAIAVNVASIPGGDLSVDGLTLNNFLKADIRVQSNWTEGDVNDPAFILNKPIVTSVINVGSFSGIQVDGDPIGTFFSVTGDIASAEKTANQGQTDFITVTFDNAMANTNYLVRTFLKSVSSGTHFEDTHMLSPVFRVLSTTSFIIGLRESGNVAQNLTVIFEVVQL